MEDLLHALETSSDLNLPNKEGDFFLHRTAKAKDTAFTLTLLQKGANPNAQNKEGLTPLHLAIEAQDEPTAKWLLSFGANPGIPDFEGNSPLDLALKKGNHSMARLMTILRSEVQPWPTLSQNPPHAALPAPGVRPPIEEEPLSEVEPEPPTIVKTPVKSENSPPQSINKTSSPQPIKNPFDPRLNPLHVGLLQFFSLGVYRFAWLRRFFEHSFRNGRGPQPTLRWLSLLIPIYDLAVTNEALKELNWKFKKKPIIGPFLGTLLLNAHYLQHPIPAFFLALVLGRFIHVNLTTGMVIVEVGILIVSSLHLAYQQTVLNQLSDQLDIPPSNKQPWNVFDLFFLLLPWVVLGLFKVVTH